MYATSPRARRGKILVLMVLFIPALLGVIAVVMDGGIMFVDYRALQHATDAAATAAAMELRMGRSAAEAREIAQSYIKQINAIADASVTVQIPPVSGPFAGEAGYVEVDAMQPVQTHFLSFLGNSSAQSVRSRAVAGVADVTAGAALVVLDETPAAISIAPVPPLVEARSALIGGLEVEGLGELRVDGAVLVNTLWGGVDENGSPAGDQPGPPYGISCTPLLPLTQLRARDIRVAGGVDSAANYGAFDESDKSPLTANRLPVPDPLAELPVPSAVSDPANAATQSFGHVNAVALPVVGVTLSPGVYESIQVAGVGSATFMPGIYVIRGINPTTRISLNVLTTNTSADGVLFYITPNAAFDVATGQPDASQAGATPADPPLESVIPSVVVNLLGASISGLQDPASPFFGMVIYQHRLDRRPIVLVAAPILGGNLSGTVYSKWGHCTALLSGTYDARFVVGTLRVVTLFDTVLSPSHLLPPAQDVVLAE